LDENDETEDLHKEKLDQLPVKQKPKCHECGWSFILKWPKKHKKVPKFN
jgi:hypothetical protein